MYASAMTLASKHDGDAASYLEIAHILTDQGARGHIDSDLAQLFRRLLFSISLANRDDHLRNHGFLWQGIGWRLPQPRHWQRRAAAYADSVCDI